MLGIVARQEFLIVLIGWAEKEIQRGVGGSIQEIIFLRLDIFLQHAPKIFLVVSTR
jgi:hypothetical protein